MEVKRAVIFAILMENNNGILGKAPAYIEEKLYACGNEPHPELLLDPNNLAKYQKWCLMWEDLHRREYGDL